MTALKDVFALVQPLAESNRWAVLLAAGILLVVVAARILGSGPKQDGVKPPELTDVIPYISNTYQYLTDMRGFLTRATRALQQQSIVGFKLGRQQSFFVTGSQNIQALFRPTADISSDLFLLIVMENFWDASKEDIDKFARDKSGRLRTPAPGWEGTPEAERYWAGMHNTMHEYLARTVHTNKLADTYYRFFSQRFQRFPLGEWADVRIFHFLKQDMAMAATTSLLGTRMFEVNPDMLKLLWEFDAALTLIGFGPPKWMFREAWKKRDRFNSAIARYLDAAWANFDPSGPDADADWEENFGSRFNRELTHWMKRSNFSRSTSAGLIGTLGVLGMNSNTLPIATWAVMEVIKDPGLFQAVRDEVLTAYNTDTATGERTLDAQKLLTLPLLQSVYIEALRMHMCMNITRQAVQPISLDGFTVPRGSMLQIPTEIALYNEDVWASEGHPASEFWAARHIRYTDGVDEAGKAVKVPQFDFKGRSNAFIPFGGGVSMCPGRHFAKQEIMMTIGIIVARFDIEFVEWTKLDGSPSDREARNDDKFAGGAAIPPDRDMRVRWKRLW